ncbi:glutathione S-transferase [Oceanomicrobium pacificus]|uniref:Glutathione S-transferase n=1 Tax=Oceanomicrobium pacificus TaxID=2692916 RepID=A0A6B0TTH3_9RHOB|nr:glutathione S-transferase [Oceanomicrobium pacificus]MXU64534.1 glutathione S-transferase [Oceanomicrobium pacificus]
MILYHNPASPFVRKVRMLLAETGQTASVDLKSAVGTPTDSGTLPLAENPLGKIPCLVRNDGPALYDSRVICRYLDTQHTGAPLYPGAPRLWDTLVLEATADGIMDAAVLMIYEGRTRPEDRRHAPWVEAQWAKVTRGLDALEGRWMAHLRGPLDMGQLAVAAALGYLDFRHADRDWRSGRPALAAWEEEFRARPSVQSTIPEG